MPKLMTGLLLLCLCFNVAAKDDPSPLLLISSDTKQTGAFKQERWLAILDEPLVSEGTFVIETNEAIRWQITTPFVITYLFDGKTLMVTEFGESKQVGKNEDPMLYGFFSFFFNIFNLSYEEMSGWFEITKAPSETGSRITLRPTKTFMKKAFEKAIVIEEAGAVKRITIEEAKGDKLNLDFSYASNETP